MRGRSRRTSRRSRSSFAFDAVCYATTLALVALIAWRLKPKVAPLAVLIAGCNGHLAFTTLSDSDMTMFMPLALGIFLAALSGRAALLAILLAVAAWTRPEGMVLSGLLFIASAVGFVARPADRREFSRYGIAAIVGLVASAGVLLLNYRLTGAYNFQSVLHKSYFETYPLSGALIRTTEDLAGIWTGAFFGLGSGARAMLVPPLIGAAFFIAGFYSRPRESAGQSLAQNWWLAGILASTLLVASSGWSGAVHDRYLGWITPFICIYAAMGMVAVAERLNRPSFATGATLAFMVLQTIGAMWFFGIFMWRCLETAALADFARSANTQLPANESICVDGVPGIAFYMPGRSVRNLQGICSPSLMFRKTPEENLEKFKYEPGSRFDCWILRGTDDRDAWYAPLVGKSLMRQDVTGLQLGDFKIHKADWSVFAHSGTGPLREDIRARIAGMTQVDSLDVGYVLDETLHRRTVFTRIPGVRFQPFAAMRTIGKTAVMEAGEVVCGSETFLLHPFPGRPLRIVMRTAATARVQLACADGKIRDQEFETASPLHLRVNVNGGEPQDFSLPIDSDAATFDEISFELPAVKVTGKETEITIGGDHIACAYWFYQQAK